MSNTFVFSKILPKNSIVNPSVYHTDYLDFQSPFSFFDYLKHLQSDLSPNDINNLYIDYIKDWNIAKNNTQTQINDSIQQRYTDLLKEITLNYTTKEEKRFLTNIDFSDETDLEIVLPFYSKKIREICDFYLNKRERLKYKTEKNKIKGTENSVHHSIYDTITDIIFSDSIEIGLYQKNVDKPNLLKNLNIEIEELYDLYSSYLDNDPDKTYSDYDVKNSLRQQIYSSNINAIDAYLYLDFDKAVKNQLLENIRTFLTEFGRIFTINYDIDSINLNCKPDEKLYNLVTDNKPTATKIVQLRNSLIKKYIGSDFYYIQTGSTITDVTSAVLFKADNPTGNLLNRHFPSTASVEEETDLQSCRRIGLFFTPEKNSILYFSVPEMKYKINSSKLEPNKLYIFPDPDRYGNTSGLSRRYEDTYPLIHICEYTKSVKNYSTPATEGDIDSNPYTQDFYSYFTKNQIKDNIDIGEKGLKTNFSNLYDKGILTKWVCDIYGNQYGLFKPKRKKYIIHNYIIINSSQIVCEEYDGGPVTFSDESLLPENTMASNSNWVYENVWSSSYYYNLLIEGGIVVKNGLMERGMFQSGYIVDGLDINIQNLEEGIFDIDYNNLIYKDSNIYIDGEKYNNIDPETLIDPIVFKWDINSTTGPIHPSTYNSLLENNYYIRSPKNLIPKPSSSLDGNPDINASDFEPEFSYKYILSSVKYKDFDAGNISDICSMDYNFEDQTKFIIQQVQTNAKTLTAENTFVEERNFNELRNFHGTIYIKDVVSGNISPLLIGLNVQFKKYNNDIEILEELENSIIDFNIYNDIIWLRTKNYIIVEKIKYEDTKFVYSGTIKNFLKYGSYLYLNNTSNPFILENKDYALMVELQSGNVYTNNFLIIPNLYKINYKDGLIEKIYPSDIIDAEMYKNNSEKNNIKLTRINKPVITYNTRNNKFCVLAIIEDQNEFPYIYQMKFEYDGENVLNKKITLYNLNDKEYFKTINFNDNNDLSSNNIILNNILENTINSIIDGVLTFS